MAYQFNSFQELFDAYADVNPAPNPHNANANDLLAMQHPATASHLAEAAAQKPFIRDFVEKMDRAFAGMNAAQRAKVPTFLALLKSNDANHPVILDPEHAQFFNVLNTFSGAAQRFVNFLQLAVEQEKAAVAVATEQGKVAALKGATFAQVMDATNALHIPAVKVQVDAMPAAILAEIDDFARNIMDPLNPRHDARFLERVTNPGNYAAAMAGLSPILGVTAPVVIAYKSAEQEVARLNGLLAGAAAAIRVPPPGPVIFRGPGSSSDAYGQVTQGSSEQFARKIGFNF